ncbi:TPA: hypothetical protein ACN6ZQ_004661, partial [Escherichia albertii]
VDTTLSNSSDSDQTVQAVRLLLKSIAHHNYFSVVTNIALFFILMRFYQGLWSFDVYRRGNYQWKIFAG